MSRCSSNGSSSRPATSTGIRTTWHSTRPTLTCGVRSQGVPACPIRAHSAGRFRVQFPRSKSEAGIGFSRRGPCPSAFRSGIARKAYTPVTDASVESSVSLLTVEPSIAETYRESPEPRISQFQNMPTQLERPASAVELRGKAVWSDAVKFSRFPDGLQKTARRYPRAQSAPGGGSMEVTTRGLVPDLKQEWLDTAEVDENRRRTYPPMLWLGPVRTGRLHGLLEQCKFKQCYSLIRDCFREESNASVDAELHARAKEDAECCLVGQVTGSKVRQVLLLWVVAVCLEALGWADRAVTIFSRCVGLDPGNPMHPYHRGVCLLRLGNAQAAHFDLQLAISQCLAKNKSPPLLFLVARALAASCLPGKMPEVWADFELVRQWCRNPELKLPQLLQKVKARLVGSFEAFSEAVLAPMPPDTITRHWATFVISRGYATREVPSAKEMVCTIGLLRRLPEIGIYPRDFLEKHILQFYAQHVPAGQPLFLEKNWCCLVHGTLDVVRFSSRSEEADRSDFQWISSAKLSQGHSLPSECDCAEESNTLSIPSEFIRFPNILVVSKLNALTSFRYGDSFGPCGDEWLVANTDIELICLPLRTLNAWSRKWKGRLQATAGNDVSLLRKSPLFQHCSNRFLQIALEEFLELHEVIYGSDPIGEQSGILIIRTGQLQLLTRAPEKAHHVRACTQDICIELCTLGPGDVIREEDLLGGIPLSSIHGSRVVSPHLEFWTLPSERRSDADGSGLVEELKLGQEASRREVEFRIAETVAWVETKQKVLDEVLGCKQRLGFPLLGRSEA